MKHKWFIQINGVKSCHLETFTFWISTFLIISKIFKIINLYFKRTSSTDRSIFYILWLHVINSCHHLYSRLCIVVFCFFLYLDVKYLRARIYNLEWKGSPLDRNRNGAASRTLYIWIHKKAFHSDKNFFSQLYFRPDPFYETGLVKVNESERLNS